MLGFLLLVLAALAAIAYIVWDYKRKIDAQTLASAGRLEKLLTASRKPDASQSAVSPPVSDTQALGAEGAPSAPLYVRRERLLSPPQTLLYYLLKTGLPDHLVFARVNLAALLDAGPGLSGLAREEGIQKAVELTVDFAVTDKNTRPIAVVELSAHEHTDAAAHHRTFARTRLAAAGVRYLELDAARLPRKDALRALVLGEAVTADARTTPAKFTT